MGDSAIEKSIRGVIGACYEVSNALGAGYLEKVYERAMIEELTLRGHRAEAQVPIPVTYKGKLVGDYFADILVDGLLTIELKCCDALSDVHMAQCINYLKATGHKIALLVNFEQARVEWKRVVLGY